MSEENNDKPWLNDPIAGGEVDVFWGFTMYVMLKTFGGFWDSERQCWHLGTPIGPVAVRCIRRGPAFRFWIEYEFLDPPRSLAVAGDKPRERVLRLDLEGEPRKQAYLAMNTLLRAIYFPKQFGDNLAA